MVHPLSRSALYTVPTVRCRAADRNEIDVTWSPCLPRPRKRGSAPPVPIPWLQAFICVYLRTFQPGEFRGCGCRFVLSGHRAINTGWRANTLSTAFTTSATVIRFMHRKSMGHCLKKQGLHST